VLTAAKLSIYLANLSPGTGLEFPMQMGEISPPAFGPRRRLPFLAELVQLTAAPPVPQDTATLSGTLNASTLSSRTTLTAGQLRNGLPNEEGKPTHHTHSALTQRFDAAKEKLMNKRKLMMRRQKTR